MTDRVAENLVKAIDTLIVARAKQQISLFVENAEGASYHAETAIKAQQIIKELLTFEEKL